MDILTLERLETLFLDHGYDKISSNLPEFNFYCHKEVQGINVLHVIDYKPGLYITEDQYAHLKEKISDFFQQRGEREIHVMTLILCADVEKAKKLCEKDSLCWIIDTTAWRLMIHETQVADFYGWKDLLEGYLFSLVQNGQKESEGAPSGRKAEGTRDWRSLPLASILLVAVNIILFLICTFTGDLLYNRGAFSVAALLQEGQFYRLFTSIFLHWNVEHLFSNMVVLYYVGVIVERKLGSVPYTVLYLLSGLVGNIFSVGYEMFVHLYRSSVGASGAVFGVEGALLLLVMAHRGRLESMTLSRVAFAVAFSLYCGFTSPGVNNAAHVGGVLMGFTTAAVITACKKVRTGFGHR